MEKVDLEGCLWEERGVVSHLKIIRSSLGQGQMSRNGSSHGEEVTGTLLHFKKRLKKIFVLNHGEREDIMITRSVFGIIKELF